MSHYVSMLCLDLDYWQMLKQASTKWTWFEFVPPVLYVDGVILLGKANQMNFFFFPPSKNTVLEKIWFTLLNFQGKKIILLG